MTHPGPISPCVSEMKGDIAAIHSCKFDFKRKGCKGRMANRRKTDFRIETEDEAMGY